MKKSMILVLCFLFVSLNLLARTKDLKKNIENKSAIKEKKTVAIFPFYDYSESSMKFIADYLPEKIADELEKDTKISVIIGTRIREELRKEKLTARDIYFENDKAMKLLAGVKADIAIIGRYITHGKMMKINYSVLRLDGKVVQGKLLEVVVDDRLLATLEKDALKINNWIKNNTLGYSISSSLEKFEFVRYVLAMVKDSSLGMALGNRWIVFAVIVLLFLFFSKFIVFFIEKVVKRITDKTATEVDDLIVAISKKPLKWIIMLLGVKFAFVSLQFKNQFSDFVNKLCMAIIILLITYVLSETVSILIRAWGKKVTDKIQSRIDDDLIPLFVKISKIVLIIIGILMALATFDVDIAPLIASLGIAGFAIGFAVKDSLANIIGGIVLILDQSFAVGDKVSIDGDVGVIQEVGLRNTKLMTYDNEIIVIPNGELMNKKFKNYVLPDPKIRVLVNFGVAYGSDVDKVEELVLAAISKMEDICDDPAPAVVFHEMGDFALQMQAKVWVPNYANQYAAWITMTKIVYKALTDAGVDIPFPTRTVYLKNE